MSNSNITPNILASQVVFSQSKVVSSVAYSLGVWYQLATKTIDLASSSSKVLIQFAIGITPATTPNIGLRVLRNGVVINSVSSPGNKTNCTSGIVQFNSSTNPSSTVISILDNPGSSGIKYYSIELQVSADATIPINRAASESSSTCRTLSHIFIEEI